ncbi:MAG: hypothetical protein V4674_01285 [Patescibacteria group bacterium]
MKEFFEEKLFKSALLWTVIALLVLGHMFFPSYAGPLYTAVSTDAGKFVELHGIKITIFMGLAYWISSKFSK